MLEKELGNKRNELEKDLFVLAKEKSDLNESILSTQQDTSMIISFHDERKRVLQKERFFISLNLGYILIKCWV